MNEQTNAHHSSRSSNERNREPLVVVHRHSRLVGRENSFYSFLSNQQINRLVIQRVAFSFESYSHFVRLLSTTRTIIQWSPLIHWWWFVICLSWNVWHAIVDSSLFWPKCTSGDGSPPIKRSSRRALTDCLALLFDDGSRWCENSLLERVSNSVCDGNGVAIASRKRFDQRWTLAYVGASSPESWSIMYARTTTSSCYQMRLVIRDEFLSVDNRETSEFWCTDERIRPWFEMQKKTEAKAFRMNKRRRRRREFAPREITADRSNRSAA